MRRPHLTAVVCLGGVRLGYFAHGFWPRGFFSSDFEGDDGDGREKDGDNPESDGDHILMERRTWLFDEVLGTWNEFALGDPEMVVDRRALEHPEFLSLLVAVLGIHDLHDDREALHEEDSTEDWQEQLLVDDDRCDGDDTADGKRSGVAHEHLGRVEVIH